MARFITPGKSPLKRARFYKTGKAGITPAAYTPITIAAITAASVSNAVTVATASITPVANRLYLVSVVSLNAVSVVPNPPTLSGCGISWVSYAGTIFDNSGTSLARSTLFYGLSAAPTAGALTADFGAQLQDAAIIVVDEASNVNTANPVAQFAVNQNQTAATDLTAGLAAFASLNNATYATFGKETVAATAYPLGGLANLALFDVSGKITAQTAYLIGNTLTPGVSWSAACQNSAIAIEINSVSTTVSNTLNAGGLDPSDAGSGTISTTVAASSSSLDPADSASGVIATAIALGGAVYEMGDVGAGLLTQLVSTTLNGTGLEGSDLSAGVVTTLSSLTGSPLEATDNANGSIAAQIALSSSASESNDAAAGAALLGSSTSLNASPMESADTASGSLASTVALSGSGVEGADAASCSASSLVALAGASGEGGDRASGAASNTVSLGAAVVEASNLTAGWADSTVSLTSAGLEGLDVAATVVVSPVITAIGAAPGGSDTRKKKRFLVQHEGQTLAFDSRRAADRAVYQLGAKAVLVAQPFAAVADTAARLAAQRVLDDAQDENDIEMLLLSL